MAACGLRWPCSVTCYVCGYMLVSGIWKVASISGSSSSDIGPSALQVVLSVGDGASGVTGVSGLNTVGEDNLMMFET